ncbi:hypothetical protein NE237_022118 [Protea cynaroides]|uniref:glutathione transferase n=1 Tax=Protea cynaroides TaxID=273540 RepID=A0A9Q0K378_9MAGN|nr:hypothetical protein NE237_022118 [Protea cynaroides]
MADMIMLYGSVRSTALLLAITAFHEKCVEFEFVPINSATGEQKKEPYLSLNVEAHQYDPIASKLVFEQVVKPLAMKMEADSAVVEENEKKLGQVLDVYEARLDNGGYDYAGGYDF